MPTAGVLDTGESSEAWVMPLGRERLPTCPTGAGLPPFDRWLTRICIAPLPFIVINGVAA